MEYNVTEGTWVRRADLIQGRYWHSCVYVKDKEHNFRGVLVAGGYTGGHNLDVDILAHSELLDMGTGMWRRGGGLEYKERKADRRGCKNTAQQAA